MKKEEQPLFEMVEVSDPRTPEQIKKGRELMEYCAQLVFGHGIPRGYWVPCWFDMSEDLEEAE